jgi:hypothetical protein
MEVKYEVKSRIKVAFRTIYNQIKTWKFLVDRGVASTPVPQDIRNPLEFKKGNSKKYGVHLIPIPMISRGQFLGA